MLYFNYSTFWPADWWSRRSFLRAWWSIYAGDPRWVPPDNAALKSLTLRTASPLWQGLQAQPLYMEALPRRERTGHSAIGQPLLAGAVFEEAVAACVLHFAPEHDGGTAYLGLLRCANDEETLERLLGTALEAASERGCTRLVGPVGVIPAWESGALTNQFHVIPPLHTPYNPPYLPDLLASVMAPVLETTLYELPAHTGEEAALAGPAKLEPLPLFNVDAALAPLVAAALTPHAAVDDVAAHEVEVLREWIGAWPAAGWLARVDGEVVGFVLAQPDTAALMRRARGGRRLPLRLYRLWARRRPPMHGRLLLGAVAPKWRRHGIGAQLLHQVLRHAQAEGWTGLACGPYAPNSAAARLMERFGAQPVQRYHLYEWNAW